MSAHHLTQALLSACGLGDLEFLTRWAERDADGFAKFLDEDGTGAVALAHAVQRNQPECVHLMLQHVDANAPAPEGHRPIVEASKRGHLRVMRILLDHGADPNLTATNDNYTALAFAASTGLRETVLLLLERGARVNLQIDGSSTALSLAALDGHLEVMRDLFAAGADHSLANRCGESPLLMASKGCHLEAAELLLAWGADVTLATFDDGTTTLMMAARGGYAHLAAQFLAKAAEVGGEGAGQAFLNARDIHGETALMKACKRGSESVVRVLLQHPRLDVDAQDDRHYTALLLAVCAEHAGIVQALLEHGESAKPDARANSSALVEACERGLRGTVRLILEERGGEEAGLEFRDDRGSTALVRACWRIDPVIADMLLRAGAAVDAMDADGWTALMFAASSDTGARTGAEVARLLVERGADPNAHGPSTTTPLMMACERSAPEFGAVLQALIRAGADVNAAAPDGATPLQVAIDHNNKEAVRALLNRGARVQADNAQRQLVDYVYELKRDLEAVLQVFPHALAASSRGVSARQLTN